MNPEVSNEQAHLESSRRALARMRERTASMASLAGDRMSAEYLKFTLYKRMKALEDDLDIPLFFGRLDYDGTKTPSGPGPGERFYVGRRHITDEQGEPMVVDWRAPISRPFYRASRVAPLGLSRRRRFGFQHGAVTAYEDESFVPPEAAAGTGPLGEPAPGPPSRAQGSATRPSAILEAEIERPRVGPMRDIVATIQPDQDDIVRADLRSSVCVQGAPGTGKTAVGLHRAAYLLYAHRDQLSRQGVLVVGPNASFLRYIGDVLPALGEIDATQTTLEQLVGRVRIGAVDSPEAARLKGDARIATVIERAVWSMVAPAPEGLVVPIGARRWRIPAYEADEIVGELRTRGVRYDAGRLMLPQRLAHAILVKMELAGDSPDDRVQSSVARSRPVKLFAGRLWPKADPGHVILRLLGDRAFLAVAADGVLTPDEQDEISWPAAAKGVGSARWSLHDAVLVDEAADVLERTPSVGHLVLDEAQDLSAMMLRAVGRHCSTGSATVLGDLAQATTVWSVGSWPEALAHLGKPDAHVEELTLGFRVPGQVIEYAARLLPVIAPSLAPPESLRRARGELDVRRVDHPVAAAVDSVASMLGEAGSIGVVVADPDAPAVSAALTRAGIDHSVVGDLDDAVARVDVVPASWAKGLEFDRVVLVEPADIVAGESDETTGLRRLYVCLTRAVTALVVTHRQPVPGLGAGTGPAPAPPAPVS